MKKYMLTFFGGNMSLRYENLGEADQEARIKHQAAWGKWMADLSKAKTVEVGYPLEPDGKRIDQSGAADYRFPDTTEGGCIIINAESLEECRGNRGRGAHYREWRTYSCAPVRRDETGLNEPPF